MYSLNANFDESGIVINLSQYSELPFVMGVFSVSNSFGITLSIK